MALDRAAPARARENAARRATRVVAQAVGAGAACDAAVRDLVSETAEWEMEAFVESKQAEAFVESTRALALVERVAALERDAAFENAPPKTPSRRRVRKRARRAPRGDPAARRAGRRAVHAREARRIRETRSERWRRAARAGSGARGDAKASRRRERCDGTRGIGGVGAAEARRRLARADAESRRRDEVMRRARAAAAARDAAIAGLLAEVTVTDDIDDIGEEDRVEDEDDRVLVGADARLASAANAAARLLREARASRDASLRETFELRTRFEHAANDAARSAAAAASSSAKLEACSAAREALDMKSRALTHRLANREAALERAAIETEKTRRDADVVARACAATRAANATLTALVSDRDAQLATTRHELERSETQNVESLLVEVALQTAHEETRDALAKEKAARVSERDHHETALAVARRREETTKARFAQSQRALRVAHSARDAWPQKRSSWNSSGAPSRTSATTPPDARASAEERRRRMPSARRRKAKTERRAALV